MRRRLTVILLCTLLVLSLALTASADNAGSGVQIYATVDSDGNAQFTLSVRIRLETPVDSLSFPLPAAATNITMNDGSVNTTRGTSAIYVDLGSGIKGYTGDYLATFQFTIPDVVRVGEDERLIMELPLLSGFEYPVESMNFTVMLPSAITTRPAFKSTYHQDSIETILTTAVSNNVVTGQIVSALKDRETMSLVMQVTTEMFSGVSTYVRKGNPEVVPMGICAGLAFLYWLIFLRAFPLMKVRRVTPPEGITAGELGSRLTFCGGDLTMMVFSWAQLGYIMIHLDDDGRVTLHKRMDMGNERSAFEGKVFSRLFGKKRYLDATGSYYARLAAQVDSGVPGRKTMTAKGSGSTKLFRWLACGVQLFCGICFAMNLTGVPALQVILAIALGAIGAVSAWLIQAGMFRLHLRYRLPVLVSLVLSILWIAIGIWAGQWLMGLLSAAAQLLAGIAAAYGGRRSPLGRQNGCQILGYRHYLKTLPREDIRNLLDNDPEYFYNTLPFAMALGVDKTFAGRFDKKRKFAPCPYFVCGIHGKLSAGEWAAFFHEAAQIMDERWRKAQVEKYSVIQFR